MGRSCFLNFVLFSAVLALCISQGYGRKLMTTKNEDSSITREESLGKSNEMIEVLDYTPEANTNQRAGYLFTPPPPTSLSAPSPKP